MISWLAFGGGRRTMTGPKSMSLLLAIMFVLLSASLLVIYILMRDVTTSTDKFEAIPTYIMSIHMLVCGGVIAGVGELWSGGRERVVMTLASGVIFISLILSVTCMVISLCLAQRLDNYTLCTVRGAVCICRAQHPMDDVMGLSTDGGWTVFRGRPDCTQLSHLLHLILSTAFIYALAIILSVVSIALLVYNYWTSEDAGVLTNQSDLVAQYRLAFFPPTYEQSRHHPVPPTNQQSDEGPSADVDATDDTDDNHSFPETIPSQPPHSPADHQIPNDPSDKDHQTTTHPIPISGNSEA